MSQRLTESLERKLPIKHAELAIVHIGLRGSHRVESGNTSGTFIEGEIQTSRLIKLINAIRLVKTLA